MPAADFIQSAIVDRYRRNSQVTEPGEFAWRVLGLLNLFRLTFGAVLLMALAVVTEPRIVGELNPALAWLALVAMLAVGCIELVFIHLRRPSVQWHTYGLFGADLAVVIALVHAGGISSGLGGMLVLSIGVLALLSPPRRAFAFAAGAALAVLGEQTLAQLNGQASAEQYLAAGTLGAFVFLIVAITQLVRGRLVETEALAEQREVDLRNLVELNDYIVQHLRESIAVVDGDNEVRLINESAIKQLGIGPRRSTDNLIELSADLAERLSTWRSSDATVRVKTFTPEADPELTGDEQAHGEAHSSVVVNAGDTAGDAQAATDQGAHDDAPGTTYQGADDDAPGTADQGSDDDAPGTTDQGADNAKPDSAGAAISAFPAADGTTMIQPHFAPLGPNRLGGAIIFLEDTSLIAERVQQTKLAALGRLSASIAHEIRNPLGALSHAGQLLAESPDIVAADKRLTDIICVHAKRLNQIVDSVLSLSRRDQTRPERLPLTAWMTTFANEFVRTMELYEGAVTVTESDADLAIEMDPTHLHQVVWNLCENAVKYASATAGAIAVELRCGHVETSGRPFLEVADRGPGVAPDMADHIFEPFFTGQANGTGLGLYISRELCERNGALLRYLPRPGGGSRFSIVFPDPHRWQRGRVIEELAGVGSRGL